MSDVDFYEEDSNLQQIQSFQKPPKKGLVGLLHTLGISNEKAANTLLILVICLNVILTICVFVFFN